MTPWNYGCNILLCYIIVAVYFTKRLLEERNENVEYFCLFSGCPSDFLDSF